jgi:hypothetical protein
MSEEEQKASVTAVFETRKKLRDIENGLRHELEGEGFEVVTTENAHERYAFIKSLRIHTDNLCSSMSVGIAPVEKVNELRKLIRFIQELE